MHRLALARLRAICGFGNDPIQILHTTTKTTTQNAFGREVNGMEQTCEVIVDIAHANVDRLYSYLVPEGMLVFPGSHVLVPFGSGNRQREGFVIRVLDALETPVCADDAQTPMSLKPLLRVIEPYPILTPEQIDLAFWMQKSYFCLLVDALRLMIPAQLRGSKVKEKIERTVQLSSPNEVDAQLLSLLDKSGSRAHPSNMKCSRRSKHLRWRCRFPMFWRMCRSLTRRYQRSSSAAIWSRADTSPSAGQTLAR
jgi:primosomal protein N'